MIYPDQVVLLRPHLRDLPPVPRLPDGHVLRPFGAGDASAALGATLAAAFGEEWDDERVRRNLTEASEVRAVYVVEHGGVPVATASSAAFPARFPGAGVIHWVATHPDHLRRGLASALVAHLLGEFRDRGDERAALVTETYRLPAIRVYLRHGFLPAYDPEGEDHRGRWMAVFGAMFGGGIARRAAE